MYIGLSEQCGIKLSSVTCGYSSQFATRSIASTLFAESRDLMSVTDSNVMDNKFYCWTQPNATDGWSWPMFLSEPADSDVLLVTCSCCCCFAEGLQYIRSTSVLGSGKPHRHLYSYRSLAVHNSFQVAYTFQPYIQTIRLHFSFIRCCLQWRQNQAAQPGSCLCFVYSIRIVPVLGSN